MGEECFIESETAYRNKYNVTAMVDSELCFLDALCCVNLMTFIVEIESEILHARNVRPPPKSPLLVFTVN